MRALADRRTGTMTTPFWPCHTCGAPGVRNLCARGYCAWHLMELYATFENQALFQPDPTAGATQPAASKADLAFLDEGQTVYGFVMCSSCRRVVADVDEWEICGAHGGRVPCTCDNKVGHQATHYCNGRLRRFTRRAAEQRVRRAAA